jgi:hypothetical protein
MLDSLNEKPPRSDERKTNKAMDIEPAERSGLLKRSAMGHWALWQKEHKRTLLSPNRFSAWRK